MTDTSAPLRVEPTLDPAPSASGRVEDLIAAVETAPPPAAAPLPTPAAEPPRVTDRLDQLSRIEDKTARIEEKYARTEALMLRVGDKVDAAVGRMGEVASQADLAALRQEVSGIAQRLGGLPGIGALMGTAVVTALLTAVAVLAVLKLAPGIVR